MRQEEEGDVFRQVNHHCGQLGLDRAGDAGRTAHISQCYTNSRVVPSLELAHEGRPSGNEVQMLWGQLHHSR